MPETFSSSISSQDQSSIALNNQVPGFAGAFLSTENSRGFSFVFWAAISLFVVTLTVFRLSILVPSFFPPRHGVLVSALQEPGAVVLKHENDRVLEEGDILKEGDLIQASKQANFSLFGEGVVRLQAGSTMRLISAKEQDGLYSVSFLLEGGRAWVNTLFMPIKVTIVTPATAISGNGASFDVSYGTSNVTVFTDRHYVSVGLKAEDDSAQNDKEFLNQFTLVQGYKVTVSENQVDERLLKLLSSKLLKIFPVTELNREELSNDSWINFNQTQDKKLRSELEFSRNEFITQRSSDQNPVSYFNVLGKDYVQMIGSYLTFDPKRRAQFLMDDIVTSLSEAEQLFIKTRSDQALEKMSAFQNSWNGVLSQYQDLTPDLKRLIAKERVTLMHVLPGNDLYAVKKSLRELWFSRFVSADDVSGKFMSSREQLMEVYDLLDQGKSAEAKQAFLDYSQSLQTVLLTEDFSGHGLDLEEERFLLLPIVSEHLDFYQLEIYKIIGLLEKEILLTIANPVYRDEARISFVNDKLRFLSRLVLLVNDEKLDLRKAIPLGDRLIQESEQYQRDTGIDVAAGDYFQGKIDEFKLLFEFFTSPEYEASHYQFQKNVYDEFIASKKAYRELQAYLATLEKGIASTSPRVNDQTIQNEIVRSFEKEGFFVSEISSLGDPGRRLYSIEKIVYQGQPPFSANYDRVTQVVYEINLGDKFFSSGKTLKNLALLLQKGTEEEAQEPIDQIAPPASQTSPNDAQELIYSIAIKSVLKRMEQVGIVTLESQVKVIDVDNNHFELQHVTDSVNKELEFSFEYFLETDEADSIVVHKDGEDQSIQGIFQLEKVLEVVRQKGN